MTAQISVEQFRRELRAKRVPFGGGVYRVTTEPPVAVDGAERTWRCARRGCVDRCDGSAPGDGLAEVAIMTTFRVRLPQELKEIVAVQATRAGKRRRPCTGDRLDAD
jgi:hypothetical protein